MLGQDEQPQRLAESRSAAAACAIEQSQAGRPSRIEQAGYFRECQAASASGRPAPAAGRNPIWSGRRGARATRPTAARAKCIFAQVLAKRRQVATFDDGLSAVIDHADLHLQVRRQPFQVEHLRRNRLAGKLRQLIGDGRQKRPRSKSDLAGDLGATSATGPRFRRVALGSVRIRACTLSATRPGTSQPSRSSESCASPSRGTVTVTPSSRRSGLEVIDQRQLHAVEVEHVGKFAVAGRRGRLAEQVGSVMNRTRRFFCSASRRHLSSVGPSTTAAGRRAS